VVSSNQATIWAAFRALKLTPKITGYGRLLETLAA
jgi:maleate cis-trans isomerase